MGVLRSPVMPAAASAAARFAAAFLAAFCCAAAAAAVPAADAVDALAVCVGPLWPALGLLLARAGCPLISSILRKMPRTRVSKWDAARRDKKKSTAAIM